MFDSTGGYTIDASGTSFATPTVTAAAVDFIDWHRQAIDNDIDGNPGRLFVNMLLMGDRASSGADMTSGYNNLFGAGRLKARLFNNAGMDSSWGWGTGSRCVGTGETSTVTINGGAALPSSVDVFKGVAYWYDRRHETGTTIDNVDLRLRRTNGTTIASSLSTVDEKERVFSTAVASLAVRLDITGVSVTADNEGCGTNKMRVYYAYFYEDSARDDGDGPAAADVEVE